MPQPKRQCNPELLLIAKPSRRIVLPIAPTEYKRQVQDRRWFRQWVDRMYEQHPELFPNEFSEGYHLHDIRPSKKMAEVSIRRIRLPRTGAVYRKAEATRLKPDYQPKTVNTDGWKQTRAAWLALFPMIAVLRCFLHAFIQIRMRCKSKPVYPRVRYLIWRIYHVRSQTACYMAFNTFLNFAQEHLQGQALEAVNRFKSRRAELMRARRYPGAHRVSTMLERHMQPMTRCLYMARDFHGHRNTAHLLVRGWTLLHNFLPYCPRTLARSGSPYVSPFHKLNQKRYRDCWLQNLLVATSCQHEYFHQFR